MECCEMVTKCLSSVYAIFFGIAGLALVAYGGLSIYSMYLINSGTVIKTYGTLIPPIAVVSFGLILIILVLLGCCGLWKESPCCVETYSALLLLLAFSQIAFGGYCLISYGSSDHMASLYHQIDTDIYRAVQNYKYDPQWMDEIQRWMKCCGRKDPLSEYSVFSDLPNGNELPLTCCDGATIICTKDDRHQEVCSKAVSAFTFGTNFVIGWISITVGATEFIAAMLGICLSCCIWRNQMASWR